MLYVNERRCYEPKSLLQLLRARDKTGFRKVDELGRRCRLYHLGEEEVKGTVIGPITWPYEFWGKKKSVEGKCR